jgi:hypothetical protein
MHGALPCGPYKALHGGAEALFFCDHAACHHARMDQRALATLTHVFVACPRYAAARDWLADTWQAVSGHRPPMTAELLLGDREAAWPDYPAGGAADLWAALRLSWLFALWETHTCANASDRHARAVVEGTVRAMRDLIRAAWCFCLPTSHIFDTLPGRVLTRPVEEQELADFSACWSANGQFCLVTPAAQPGDQPSMQLLLSLQHPVAAPPAAGV